MAYFFRPLCTICAQKVRYNVENVRILMPKLFADSRYTDSTGV